MKQTFIVFSSLLISSYSFSQTAVEAPVHVKTEENGVKIFSSNGNENKQEQNRVIPPADQPTPKTLNDYSVEDIDNMLFGLNEKLQFLEGSNESEVIKLMKEKKIELMERRKVLTGSN